MLRLLFIAVGGALGALFRYAISGMTYRFLDGGFPWGTLVVNLSGAFAIGFLWGLSERTTISPEFRSFAFIGFIGSFTTFSTYALETINLFRDSEMKFALSNILISNVLGIILVLVGLVASKYLINLMVGR
ncbi:MAG: fluoride efflux transporter CrcB [FCB group bacterium]|nr:fluoride efflux transporter CrcB [FCB group bacterium]